jgi:hyperosmotically inducible periplasmic protein
MRGKQILRLISLGAGLTVVGLSGSALTAQVLSAARQQDPQSDNTKTNKQDSSKGAVTADQQKENVADREMARKIRQAIVQDKSLSTYAHNVKVIVRDGKVTLKGPVRSEDEKTSIGAKAADVAGADKVQNELTIKS